MFSESEFQHMVVSLATMMGLITYHTHDSRRSNPGFPDLVIVGRNGVIYRELKTDKGRVREDQAYWLEMLVDAGEDARIWRPSEDWPDAVSREMRALGKVAKVPPVVRKLMQR